jgi:hypothetical protein
VQPNAWLQDGRLGEYAFFALRSLLDIQNFLQQRQKKCVRARVWSRVLQTPVPLMRCFCAR